MFFLDIPFYRTALLRNSRVGCAALVAPAPSHETSRKYLSRIPDRSAPDTSQIGSASVADPERIGDRCTIDRNLLDRRIP